MSIAVIIGIVVVMVALWVFLFMAKRAMRWAIRLTLLGIVVLALLVGALAWWLYYGSSAPFAPAKETRPAATRRANSR
jgi:heme/copper-type cytochrome/quinol oxidase subunit 4